VHSGFFSVSREYHLRRLGTLAVLALVATPVIFGIRQHYKSAQPANGATMTIDTAADLAPTVNFVSAGEQAVPATAASANSAYADGMRGERRLYPYSVVPGGVVNADEIRAAEMRDDAVRAHYAGFNLANAHMARLAEAKFVYVSYRRGDGIFWSAKATRMAKGEAVVTDGAMMLRVRCGNRVSEVPMGPVEAVAPVAPEAMELPAGEAAPVALAVPMDVPMVPTPESAMLFPPPLPGGITGGTPGVPAGFVRTNFYPPAGSTPTKPTPPSGPVTPGGPGGGSGTPPSGPSGGTPPVTTPEPGELAMMVAGISGVVAMANRERKRSAS
jgi:hypothetical protein